MDSKHLTAVAHIYADARGITMSTLGTYLVRDANFFKRLAEGRVTIRRVELAGRLLSEIWLCDLEWPPDIPRPAPSSSVEPPGEAPAGEPDEAA